jgi:hypothetical protein
MTVIATITAQLRSSDNITCNAHPLG